MAGTNQGKKVYNIDKLINYSQEIQKQNILNYTIGAITKLGIYSYNRDYLNPIFKISAFKSVLDTVQDFNHGDYFNVAIDFAKAAFNYSLLDYVRTDPKYVAIGIIAEATFDAYRSYYSVQEKIDYLGDVKNHGFDYISSDNI
ncbi:MAG: hypothetical protein ACK4OM_04415 [Alphaproteobacteria bacterium]